MLNLRDKYKTCQVFKSLFGKAVMKVTANKLKDLGAEKMCYSTTEVGDLISERI